MLAKIQEFYTKLLQPEVENESGAEHTLRLAATALMIEVMRVDDEKSDKEIETIVQASMSKFGILRSEAEELMELASEELHDSTDYHQFTSLINKGYEMPQKLQIIEFLWEVAYADGELNIYEEHVIRKVSDLIYIPHREFIRLKERVRQSN